MVLKRLSFLVIFVFVLQKYVVIILPLYTWQQLINKHVFIL